MTERIHAATETGGSRGWKTNAEKMRLDANEKKTRYNLFSDAREKLG
jgi:hypothetical protein